MTTTLYAAAGGGNSGGVQSVTGLNTDNADPQNPVVQISVDNATITGDGTPGNPLVSTGGAGNVNGPGSATDNAIARFDGTTGKLIQNSAATVADTTGDISAGKFNGNTITSTTVTGNADTATALKNARTIGGISFDGTANITVASATGGFTVSGGNLSVSANNVATDTTTGTKFGTATNQKIAFYNSTPIVQPSGNTLTALSNLGLIATPTLASSDVGLGSVTNDAQTKAAIVPNTAPSAGQILVGNAGGTAYAPQTISGSGATITLSSAGVMTISAISNASLSNSAITIAGTSTSLGGSISQDTITGLSSTGIIKRTGANTLAIATSGTDYAPATSGSSILYGNGSGGFSNASVSANLSFSAGTLDTVQGIQTTSTPQFAKIGIGTASISQQLLRAVGSTSGGVSQAGLVFAATGDSGATTSIDGMSGQILTSAAAYTVTTGRGVRVNDASLGAGSAITTLIGVDILDQTKGGTNIGYRSQVSSGTNKWGFYSSGTASNYFLGNTTIGSTTTTSLFNVGSAAQFQIDSSGNVISGIWQGTAIGSTSGGTGIDSHLSTGVAQVSSGTWSVSTSLANGTTATTQTQGDNSTKLATTAYVDTGLATKQGALTLTTTGTSGAATLIGNTLNIPQYTGGAGGGATLGLAYEMAYGAIIF